MPETSLVRLFLEDGFDVCMVDWHVPTAEQKSMSTADYVLSLMNSLQEYWDYFNRPLLAVGYCLGGVLATALACLFERVQGLALLATPWDFNYYPFAQMTQEQRTPLQEKVNASPLFSAEDIQSLCYVANAVRIVNQFSRFSELNSVIEEMNFVAIQHWANDGVDVTQKVAQECLIDWPLHNTLMKEEWAVDGETIKPRQLDIPVFAAIPTRDNIVPYECAMGLIDQLSNVSLITPSSGHVGMVAGVAQRERLVLPLQRWMSEF